MSSWRTLSLHGVKIAFALNSGEKVLGFFPIRLYCGITDAEDKHGGPLRIPLLSEAVISDVLRIEARQEPAINERKKGKRV